MEKLSYLRYNAFLTGKGNLIWAGAMQLAWNSLRQNFAKNNPLQFSTGNGVALQIIQNFNKGSFSQKQINQKDIYVKSGYGQQTLDLINQQVVKKFPEKSLPKIEAKLNPCDIISYAYLLKKLAFDVKFQRRNKTFKFRGQKVDSFYAKNKQQKQQIRVHSYQNRQNFMVQIKDKKGQESLFLIKTQKEITVDEAIERTLAPKNPYGQLLGSGDSFQMPVIALNQSRNYKQMIGLPFTNAELHQYMIAVMFESVKLNVDQTGARVENQAVIMALRCAMPMPKNPKEIILDNSFWVVMKESGKHPYLCAYIQQPLDE